jgi:hypothetical protein
MACVNLIRLPLLLLLGCLLLAGPVYAELDRLKQAVTALERELRQAQQAEQTATEALKRNHEAQRNAEGDRLARLKTEANRLAAEEAAAAETVQRTRRNLAIRQGELRDVAAKQVVEHLNGDAQDRIARAASVAGQWQEALGPVPRVPEPRDLKDIVDPAEQAAIKAGDRARLREYDTWAKAELERVEEELKRADEALKACPRDSDAEKALHRTLTGIRQTLSTRQRSIRADQAQATRHLRALED